MGLLDFPIGTKKTAAGIPAKRSTEVREALLAVNRPALPFIVRDGSPEKVDLVAEWQIVDAIWCKVFAKAALAWISTERESADIDPAMGFI